MPETKKKPKKPRAKRLKSKKGLKQKQKQKQQVTVNVSAGGSGGGGYVPIPQSPSIDYGLISQLLRPAATTDVPIRAAAPVAEMPFVRPAEPESLASEKSKGGSSRPTPSRSPPPIPTEASRVFPPINLEGVSSEQRGRIFDFANNPNQEFLIIPKKKSK